MGHEGDEELRKLVEQQSKQAQSPNDKALADFMPKLIAYDFDKVDLPELVRTIIDERIYTKLEPIADDPDGPNEWLMFESKLHPMLRVVIPARENDDSLPKFLRNYDFEITTRSLHKKHRPRNTNPR